jgi:hypothetical protein
MFASGKLPFEKEKHDKIADIGRITTHIYVGNQVFPNSVITQHFISSSKMSLNLLPLLSLF